MGASAPSFGETMTHLEIINRALIAAGANPKEDFNNLNDNEVTSVKAFYEAAWREVLSSHQWSHLTQEERLTGVPDGSNFIFELPEACIKIISVTNYKLSVPYIPRMRKFVSAFERVTLRYVSTEGILPVDWESIETELVIPPNVDEAVSLKLASQIAFRITQNQAVQMHLHERYAIALREAKMSDLTTCGGDGWWTR